MALVPLLGAVPSWEIALVVVAALGFVTTMTAVSLQTAIQMDLDDDLRGRVMSLWIVIAIGGAALGAGTLGQLVDWLGFAPALMFAGSGTLLIAAITAFLRLRR